MINIATVTRSTIISVSGLIESYSLRFISQHLSFGTSSVLIGGTFS